jgi:membrane protease YdiL (CAAX protease family)
VDRASQVSGWRLLAALGLWLLLAGAGFGIAVLTLRVAGPRLTPSHRPDVVAGVLVWSYLALLGALAVSFGGLSGLREVLRFRFTNVGDLVLAIGTWIACLVLGGVVSGLLSPLLGQSQNNAVSLLRLSVDPLFVALVALSTCLLAPIGEELLFRGALYGWLRRRAPALAAAPLTAAVFAAAHLLPPLMPALFVFGLGAAFVRERTGSTLNTFVMHVSQNTLAVVAAYLILSR